MLSRLVLLLFASIYVTSSALAQPKLIIEIDPLPATAKTELDLRIRRVDLDGYRMRGAIEDIAQAVDKWFASHQHPYLDLHYRYSREREYVERGVPTEKYEFRNPRVRLRAVNLTLAEVFSKLCAQSGWSYDRNSVGTITFTDDYRLFRH